MSSIRTKLFLARIANYPVVIASCARFVALEEIVSNVGNEDSFPLQERGEDFPAITTKKDTRYPAVWWLTSTHMPSARPCSIRLQLNVAMSSDFQSDSQAKSLLNGLVPADCH